MYGHGDDLMWDGLACPSLEDDAFNFDTSFTHDDNIFNDPLLKVQQDNIFAGYYFDHDQDEETPHELNTLRLVLEVEEYNNTSFDYEPKHYRKDPSSRDYTNQIVALDRKMKADYDLRLEGKLTRRCGNQVTKKELNTEIQVLNLDEALAENLQQGNLSAKHNEVEENLEESELKKKVKKKKQKHEQPKDDADEDIPLSQLMSSKPQRPKRSVKPLRPYTPI
ncbi:hypothetical protein POM88_052735 [Heracleum sosnowskyi]|uniref:Uncharacterized protein n=1 Tax=Heracleum sosnowskyi TaxID=360622 RepID=A0AAD8GPZ9_9APIA|nr:hypothetical protein POM88_052735 [Heracleum sosnowskyi]